MGLTDVEFLPARRLVAWEYAAAASVDAITGVVRGPTPFGATVYTDYVPCGRGVQGFCEFFYNWATGTRPGAGLRKILLYPEFKTFYGGITPDGLTDANKAVPVLAAGSNTRLTTAALGAAYSQSTPVVPMGYMAGAPAPTADVSIRLFEMEMCQIRYAFWRPEDLGVAVTGPAFQWEERVWGQTPQTPRSGATSALRQMPFEKAVRYRVGWEGTDNAFTSAVFLPGDAISLYWQYGAPA